MKAIKAIKLSLQNKTRIRKTAEARAKKAHETAVKNEREKRKKFYDDLLEHAYYSIKEAVKEGKTSTTFTMWRAGRTPVEADDELEKHGYSDLIRKVERNLRDNGYKVGHVMTSSTHYTNYDTSDDTYTMYHKEIQVSWGKK